MIELSYPQIWEEIPTHVVSSLTKEILHDLIQHVRLQALEDRDSRPGPTMAEAEDLLSCSSCR